MAKLALEFHSEAASEYLSALTWYRDRSLNTARRFELEFSQAIEQIHRFPDRWPIYSAGCRRYLLRRFPFQIIYQKLANAVFVVAVAHTHRRPGYWKDRF